MQSCVAESDLGTGAWPRPTSTPLLGLGGLECLLLFHGSASSKTTVLSSPASFLVTQVSRNCPVLMLPFCALGSVTELCRHLQPLQKGCFSTGKPVFLKYFLKIFYF